LEISPLVIDQSDQEAIPKDLFNLCPLLERFIFPFDTTPPFDHPEAFTPHQWLDTLMLREHQNRYTFDNVVDLLIDHTSFFCRLPTFAASEPRRKPHCSRVAAAFSRDMTAPKG
jgi:hypothetical protein